MSLWRGAYRRARQGWAARHFLALAAISALLGLAWYLLLYGRYGLYVTHVGWIYNAGGDMLQHQLGWEWFRNAEWRFPLGAVDRLGYPFGTSVTYMDSIPLMALAFKLLAPWLETPFQYFGLWELLSVVLQVLAGLLIAREFTRSLGVMLLCASMLVLSTPMIFRAFYHSSLSAHWIVLAGIWLALRAYCGRPLRWAWPALFGIAMLVHLYFVPMLLPLWLISLVFRGRARREPRWLLALDLLASPAAVLLSGYLTGAFALGYRALAISGYGLFSWNLNGFINSLDFASAFARGAPVVAGQYEGISYLGVGNMLLVAVALYLFPQREQPRRRLALLLPFAAAAAVYLLFAISHKAYWGLQPVWDVPLADGLYRFLCLFRSSGRFIWPVYYLVVLFGLLTVARNLRYPVLVLGFALLLQVLDLQPLYAAKKMEGFSTYPNALQGDFWEKAAEANQYITVIPAGKVKGFAGDPLAIFAAQHDKVLNYTYSARSDLDAIRAYTDDIAQRLLQGQADWDMLYVFASQEWIERARKDLPANLRLCEVDGYTLAFSRENRLEHAGLDLGQYCRE